MTHERRGAGPPGDVDDDLELDVDELDAITLALLPVADGPDDLPPLMPSRFSPLPRDRDGR